MANLPPPLAPGPQPDWDAMGNALGTLSEEAPLFANAINANACNHAILGLLQQINARLGGIEATLNAIQETVDDIQSEMALQPMRMANTAASTGSPLVYPPGTDQETVAQLPRSKQEALGVTGARASQGLALLHVPRPQGANAQQLKIQFFRFLGIS